MEDILKITVFVAGHRQQLVEPLREARNDVFGDHRPASTFLGVEKLIYPTLLIEVEAVAVLLTSDEARSLALALPEAVEQDHHGRPSFRVGGKIFATLWDDEHMNVMLDEGGIVEAVQEHPEACCEVMWGKRLAAVRVHLRT